MACEDFPCCGHESGCCPSFDSAGNQLDMRCTCGAVLPVTARFSICQGCLRGDDDAADYEGDDEDEDSFDDGYYESCDEDGYEPEFYSGHVRDVPAGDR